MGNVAGLLSAIPTPDGAGVEAEGAATEKGESEREEKPTPQRATGAAWRRANTCCSGAQRRPDVHRPGSAWATKAPEPEAVGWARGAVGSLRGTGRRARSYGLYY